MGTIFSSFTVFHCRRRAYYGSSGKIFFWFTRIILGVSFMGLFFLRFVLSSEQISYLVATLISELSSVISYSFCVLLWGRFVVFEYTVTRFCSLHSFIPIVLGTIVLASLHLLQFCESPSPCSSLHKLYSFPSVSDEHKICSFPSVSDENKICSFSSVCDYSRICSFSSVSDENKVSSFSSVSNENKSFLILYTYFIVNVCLVCAHTNILNDIENYVHANCMTTSADTKPEWYFLFAYGLLRCIPDKTTRALALSASVFIPICIIYQKKHNGQFFISFFFYVFIWPAVSIIRPIIVYLYGCTFSSVLYFFCLLSALT